LGALSFTVLLDLKGPRVSRFGKSEVNAAAVLDDTQSGGIENSPDNGHADEEEQDTTGQFTQHVKGLLLVAAAYLEQPLTKVVAALHGTSVRD
jgi:hypothetical protein